MKISLITACYNSVATIRTCFDSVLSQQGVDLEYIVVDGGSKDGTVNVIKEYSARSTRSTRLTFKWISERDRGMYDAINKGIKMATGDVVGILNADDVLASDDTLAKIAAQFEGRGKREEGRDRIDALYADIRFVRDGGTVEELRTACPVGEKKPVELTGFFEGWWSLQDSNL